MISTLPRFEIARFADQLERSFRGGAWHGPAIAELLTCFDDDRAVRRAIPGAHSAAEIVFHTSYWIDGVRRRLAGEATTGSDWPEEGAALDWSELVAEIERRHRTLHAAVVALDDARLDDPVEGSDPTVRGMLLGLLQHNAYHAGQLALLVKAAGGAVA